MVSKVKIIGALAFLSSAIALLAANNPQGDESCCDEHTTVTERVECSQSGVSVDSAIDCTSVRFELKGTFERKSIETTEYTYTRKEGYDDCECPEDDTQVRTNSLPVSVSWAMTLGDETRSGTGRVASESLPADVCEASVSFSVDGCSGSYTASTNLTCSADVSLPSAICTGGHEHFAAYTYRGCDEVNVLQVASDDPDAPTLSVRKDSSDSRFVLTGTGAGTASVVITNRCYGSSASVDVVDVVGFGFGGACGCKTDSLSCESMGESTVTVTAKTNPENYATKVSDGSGDGASRSLGFSESPQTVRGWYDCDGDGACDSFEPQKTATVSFVRLGTLDIQGEDACGQKGPSSECGFAPGTDVSIENTDGLGPRELEVLGFTPETADDSGESPDFSLSGGSGSWKMAIPSGCPDGTVSLRLYNPEHGCLAVTADVAVASCCCSSCDSQGSGDAKVGSISYSLGLGRDASGRKIPPIRFTLQRTDELPVIRSRIMSEGRLVVSNAENTVRALFVRAGEDIPFAEHRFESGPDAFTATEWREGSVRKVSRWTVSGGVWTLTVSEPDGLGGWRVLREESVVKTTTGDVRLERRTQGGVVRETEYRRITGYGWFAVRTTVGEGAAAQTIWTAPVGTGSHPGLVASEIRPDGGWIWNEYDADGRPVRETTPFRDAAPLTDANHRIVGFSGRARRTTHSYEPVDSSDDGSLDRRDPRVTTELVGNDAEGWTVVSRTYRSVFLAENASVRRVIVERAASPDARFGDPANLRTVTDYHWRNDNAGRVRSRLSESGLLTSYAYELTATDFTTMAIETPADRPEGLPFKTTYTRTITNLKGDTLREEKWLVTDAEPAILSWTEHERNAAGHRLRSVSSNGETVDETWTCCGPDSTTDADGILTERAYDGLSREVVSTRSGVTTLTTYDAAGRVAEVTRIGAKEGLPTLTATATRGYDAAGRLAWSVGEDGIRTEYAYGLTPEGGEIRTTVRAPGTLCAVANSVACYRDGTMKETTLNGQLKVTEVPEPFATTRYEGTNGVASVRWIRTETDFLGRTVAESRPGYNATLVTSNRYDTAGRLVATDSYAQSVESIEPQPLSSTLFAYADDGTRILTVNDLNFNGIADWSETDRIVSNDTRYVSLDGNWWRETSTWQTRQDGSPELTLVGRTRTRLTEVPGVTSRRGTDTQTLAAETHTLDARGNATVARTRRNREARTTTQSISYPDSTIAATRVTTDGLLVSSQSKTGVTTTYAYDALGRPTAQTDGRGNTRRTVYDALGRVAKTIDALGHETTYTYDALGRQIAVTDPLGHTVTTTYDAEGRVLAQRGATYPVDYTYDEYGNKASMTTYRDLASGVGDTTRWLYDEPSGCMTNKVYADGKGPTYSYTPDGKLARRTWARGIVTDYSYNSAGQLILTTYSDTTPTITMSYDRVGNMTEATTANVVTNLYAYDIYGNCTNEWQNDFNLTRYYDTFGRNTGYAINGTRQTVIGYDTFGRISTMQVPAAEERMNLHSTTTTPNYNSFHWNYLPGSDLKASLQYPNGLTASWQYDANNQLLQVCNATPTNIISQFDYTYDAAGRRVAMTKSGLAMSQADTIDYAYNSRCELTNALARADVDYNYAYVYDDIGNRISSTERGTNTVYAANELNQYTAVDDFTPEFDDDGNQTLVETKTGVWQVSYNGENRPVRWVRDSDDNVLTMSYDHMGRRREVDVHHFFYSGYLQISDNNYNDYIWDPAVPIATKPLIWNREHHNSYYAHDGNKNVINVVTESSNIVANYEYAPFGMIVALCGDSAVRNPWRFSSEYIDEGTAIVYYNYRNFDFVYGRWLCMDPVGEKGGIGLYGFCGNNPMTTIDVRGENPALILFFLGVFAYPQIANAPSNIIDAENSSSSAGALAAIVDYTAGNLLTVGVHCCGQLIGFLKFRYWENVAIKTVGSRISRTSSRASAIGAAFDPVRGKVAVEISGRFIGKPTSVMEEIAGELGGLGNSTCCRHPIGACVEFKGADVLLKQNSLIENIRFTPVIRPRNNEILAPCHYCVKMLEKFHTGPVDEWQNFRWYWLPSWWLGDIMGGGL